MEQFLASSAVGAAYAFDHYVVHLHGLYYDKGIAVLTRAEYEATGMPLLKPMGYSQSYLAFRIGSWVPIWELYIGHSFGECGGRCARVAVTWGARGFRSNQLSKELGGGGDGKAGLLKLCVWGAGLRVGRTDVPGVHGPTGARAQPGFHRLRGLPGHAFLAPLAGLSSLMLTCLHVSRVRLWSGFVA
jgi:hypothetical protein